MRVVERAMLRARTDGTTQFALFIFVSPRATKMVDMIIKHSFVELNNSFVHIQQYASEKNVLDLPQILGQHEDTCNSKEKGAENVIVFVPGNPGALGIYHDFLELVFKQSRGFQILAIGHNNFDHPNHVSYAKSEKIFIDEKELNFVEKTQAKEYLHDPYHVELQVLNKLIILKRLISSETKITFVGHSIGCYVIVRLLQDKQLASAHAGSILIHPALENLASTEKGLYFDRVFKLKLDLPMKLVSFLLDTLLPRSLKMLLTRQLCSSDFLKVSSNVVLESIMQLACSRHFDALVRMAKSELATVKQLDCEQLIRPHVSRLKLLYAKEDHWVNRSHREALKQTQKNIHIEERNVMHAFVMDPKAVDEYARFVADFVRSM